MSGAVASAIRMFAFARASSDTTLCYALRFPIKRRRPWRSQERRLMRARSKSPVSTRLDHI
eukprot:5534800-Pleurochrysis_carterae.AAC.1